ncbi:ankyrin [Mytilinidion resinicola]|uniref:Ankyrin n=1 Tax=Mytilinidion resinicola TaxID=574789 RepID=A0A6A6ZAP2_9PEZI|nr:ankyrin [Mytilinidion resinicola]KAF2817365.1 ankyrin [Mytilinidion resinicola]
MSLPWELHKETIEDLYLSKNQPLKQVMDFMDTINFKATKGQYERQFKKWQLKKYSKSDQWKAIGHKLQKRKREGKESEVYLDGELVPPQKVMKAVARPSNHVSFIEKFQTEEYDIGPALTPRETCTTVSMPSSIHLLKMAIYVLSNKLHTDDYKRRDLYEQLAVKWCCIPENLKHFERLLRSKEPTICALAEAVWEPALNAADENLIRGIISEMSFDIGHLILPHHVERVVSMRNLDLTKLLIRYASNNIEQRSKMLASALQEGVSTGQVDLVKLLLEEHKLLIRYALNRFEQCSEMLAPALLEGIRARQVESVKLLVEENVDLNWRSDISYDQQTPLEVAVIYENVELVQILLSAGSDVNSVYEPEDRECAFPSALEIAIQNENTVLIELLREAGACLNFEGFDGRPRGVLSMAADTGNRSLVEEFLEAGADIDSVDRRGETALTKYVRKEDLNMVIYLLSLGAKASPPTFLKEEEEDDDDSYLRPKASLEAAIDTKNDVIIRVLLGSGASCDDPNLFRSAVATGKIWLVQLLLDKVLDASVLKECEENALQTSIECENLEVFRLILGRDTELPGSCLSEAVEFYDAHVGYEMVESLLKKGMDVNLADGNFEWTPLIRAIDNESLDIVELLLNNNADINKSLRRGSPLKVAVFRRNTSLAARLLELGATPFDTKALSAAVLNKDTDTLDILLQAISTRNDVSDKEDLYGLPLRAAINTFNTDLIDFFLKAGGALNRREIYSGLDRHFHYELCATPLEFAVRGGNTAVIRMLLERGANPNIPFDTGYGVTALVRSILQENLEATKLLLHYRADVNAWPCPYHYEEWSNRSGNLTALQTAAKIGSPEMVQTLLDAGADVHGPLGIRGLTALHLAASEGHLRVAKMLIRAGAATDVDAVSSGLGWRDTRTAGFFTKTYRFRETRTALELAAEHGRIDMVQLLLNAGADLELPRQPNKEHERLGGNSNPEQDDSALGSCWSVFSKPCENPDCSDYDDSVKDSLPGDRQYEIATGLAKRNRFMAVARLITTYREHKIING